MPKHSQRYNELARSLDNRALYDPEEAIEKSRTIANTRFNETIDVAIRLGVDPRHGDQMVRGTTNLPHGTGKVRRVACFAKGEKATEAEEAGADRVGAEDLIAEIQKGWRDFDILVATPDMMPAVGRALGRTLGPKMPSPRSGSVSNDIGRVIRDIKSASRVEYRVEKAGIVHAPIGKKNFTQEQLMDNFRALIGALLKARPAAAKGRYLKGITVSSTMGPGFRVDPQRAQQVTERAGSA